MSKITFEIISVTPQMAAIFLAGNGHNRKVKQSVVTRLAGAMTRGEWTLNGETVKFNSGSGLIDGQHRLEAIVKSGVTVPLAIVRGLPASAQETVDIGVKRSTSDLLTLRGEKNTADLGAALVQVWRFRNHMRMGESGGQMSPTPQQQLAILDDNAGLRDSLRTAHIWRERLRYPHGLAGALHHIFAEIDQEDADFFMARVADGVGLHEGDAMLTLRDHLIRDMNQSPRMVMVRRAAITIRAWNAYRDGEKLQRLQWNPGGKSPDIFPVPH